MKLGHPPGSLPLQPNNEYPVICPLDEFVPSFTVEKSVAVVLEPGWIIAR
jgi:hypothetical protein